MELALPARQSIEARLARLEDLLNNVARLHRKEVMQRYGFSSSTFHRLKRAGRLPVPIQLGGQLYRLVDLEAFEQTGQLPRPLSARPPVKIGGNGVPVPLTVRPSVQFSVRPTVQV